MQDDEGVSKQFWLTGVLLNVCKSLAAAFFFGARSY
jgi:hypothetical protein